MKTTFEYCDPGKELAAILHYILDQNKSDPRQRCTGFTNPFGPVKTHQNHQSCTIDGSELILMAAPKMKKRIWKGTTFHVFRDLPGAIKHWHAEYADMEKKLHRAGLHCDLLSSIERLIVVVNGQKSRHSFQ